MIPRRGTYVADISIKDINEVYEIRTSLEVLAAGLAAERISDEELETMQRLLVEIGQHIEDGNIEKIVEIDTAFHDVSGAFAEYYGRTPYSGGQHCGP